MTRRLRPVRTAAFLAIALVATVVVVGGRPGSDRVIEAAGGLCIADPCGPGGEFHPITPVRALDTRKPELDIAPAGRKRTGPDGGAATFDLQVTGVGDIPDFFDANDDGIDDNVLAVAVNITVVDPDYQGHVRAYGAGEDDPVTSVVNFPAGVNVPNSAILRPGRGGALTFKIVTPGRSGTTDIVVDVMGWVSSSEYTTEGAREGARLYPVAPRRLYDSREAEFGARPMGPGEQLAITLGAPGTFDPALTEVPYSTDNVVGALVNITGVNDRAGSKQTFLSALPDALPAGRLPLTSNANLRPGQRRAGLAVVPLGDDTTFHVFNNAGQIDVVIDLMGVLVANQDPATRAGRVVPLVAPFRVLDTRETAHGDRPLGPGQAEAWKFGDFVADVALDGQWVGEQLGFVGNLTAAGLARQYPSVAVSSHIRAYPTPANRTSLPSTSNLNVLDGEIVPNMMIGRYGYPDGSAEMSFFNRAGYLDYVVDVSAVILQDAAG